MNVLLDFIESELVVEFAQLTTPMTKTSNNVLFLNAELTKSGGEENVCVPLDTTLSMENVEDARIRKIMTAPPKLVGHLVEQIKYG